MGDALLAAIAQQEARRLAKPAAEAVAQTVAASVAAETVAGVPDQVTAYLRAHPVPRGLRGEQGDPGDQGEPGLEWQGDWRASSTYDPGDCVAFEGSSYVAVETSTNVPPPASPWDLLAKRGDDGRDGRSTGPIILGNGSSSGSGLPAGGNVGQVVTNTAPGTGTWQDATGGGGIDYVQDADPGSVGAKKTWLRAFPQGPGHPNNEDVFQLFVRNDTDDGWTKPGLAHWDALGHLSWYIHDDDDIFQMDVFSGGQQIGSIDIDGTAATLAHFGATANRVYLDNTGLRIGPGNGTDPYLIATASDPSAGLDGNVGSIALRTTGELWQKTGAANTDWTIFAAGASPAVDPGDIADPTLATAEDVALKLNALMAAMRTAGSLA